MSIARRSLLALVAVALASCGGQAASQSGGASSSAHAPAGEGLDAFMEGIAALVPPAADTDVLRDQLTEAVDLRGALGDEADAILQLVADTERAAYPEPPAPEASPSGAMPADALLVGYLQAIPLPPGVPPPTSDLATTLPDVLDGVGRPGAQTSAIPPNNGSQTSQNRGMTSTVTISTTGAATLTGSFVRFEVSRLTTWHVAEDAGGAAVMEASVNHSVVAEFDVCPTTAGESLAGLNQVIRLDATTHPGSQGRVGTHSTGSIDSSSEFRGKVDDSARLGTITQDYTQENEWTRTAAAEGGPESKREGGIDVAFSGINAGVPGEQGSPSIGDFSNADGTAQLSGDSTQEMINQTAVSAAFDSDTMRPAFVAAEKLWRNSRCVMVAVAEYDAESELEVTHQEVSQHTEDVELESETPFEASLRHRFGQTVTAALEAKLSGKEKLAPDSIAAPPGTLTYTAPSQAGETATVRMISTSKQGIGILVIEFGGEKKLKVTIDASGSSTVGGMTITTDLSVPEVLLVRQDDGTYLGSGASVATITIGGICPTPMNEPGTVTLRATRGAVEDPALPQPWLVSWVPTTDFTTSFSCLGQTIVIPQSGQAGNTGMILTLLGDFEFPAGGGTKQIQSTQTLGGYVYDIDGTVTGEVVTGASD